MLRTLTFREFTPPETAEGTVSEGITAIQTERNQLRQQQTEIRSSLEELARIHLIPLEAMAEELGVMREREDAAPSLGKDRFSHRHAGLGQVR
ncbi:hypothetical protein [Methanogenium cariaci]|uniref:hypothetical protein n=1 Tax=Methanogenium cariaci TaxID=2197 RepID=UPI001C48055C|nr:hypothetical protein [Methanogenium cariaci]